jgi:hypothetical protein
VSLESFNAEFAECARREAKTNKKILSWPAKANAGHPVDLTTDLDFEKTQKKGVIPAKAGTQWIAKSGFPLPRE